MEWIDGNIGSCITMKYPSCILKGDNSSGRSMSIAYAKDNQQLDAGAKMIHLGKNTTSTIISKSISESGGVAGKIVSSDTESVTLDIVHMDKPEQTEGAEQRRIPYARISKAKLLQLVSFLVLILKVL